MANKDTDLEKKIKELKARNAYLEEELHGIDTDKYSKGHTDEYLQEHIDKLAIKAGISSKVYRGRHISIILHEGGNIQVIQNSYEYMNYLHQNGRGNEYKPTEFDLSVETFIMFLEAFELAEKKFKINRKEVVKFLTEGKDKRELEFEDKIIYAG